MSMNDHFGTSSLQSKVEIYKIGELPKVTCTYAGTEADMRATGSAYINCGWKVQYTSGVPFTMVASLDGNLNSDGITPITASVSGSTTIKWAMHYKTSEKEVLHAKVQTIPWLNQLTAHQIATLETGFNSPPSDGNIRSVAVPSGSFNNGAALFSGSYTAGDVVWWMSKAGWKTIPIATPILRMTATINTGSNLTAYSSNIYRYYTKTSLSSAVGVPSNWVAAMPQDTDPASTDTFNIPMYYGWLKQPPTFDQDGGTITVQQEFEYGLYPQNVFGVRL